MGMFDSLYVKCPKCGEELEFQSKSGPCAMYVFRKRDLPISVALDLNGNIVRCQFCNSRIKMKVKIPKKVDFRLINLGTKKRFDYDGNFNEKHPYSIKRIKELEKILGK